MPAIAVRHSLSLFAPYVLPAMPLARSTALHSAQKPTVPPTHELFGLVLYACNHDLPV